MRNIHTHIVHPLEEEVVSLYENFPQCLDLSSCSLGLHPWYLAQAGQDWEVLQQYATYSHVVAIGECGLDKVSATPWALQLQYFRLQIALANQLQKPLIIHCVKAYGECLAELKAARVPVIFHGFNKSAETAKMILNKGHYLSFGHSLFREGYGEVLKQIPTERLFLETDDKTDLSIEDVYKRAADLLNFPLDALILQLEKNYQNIL